MKRLVVMLILFALHWNYSLQAQNDSINYRARKEAFYISSAFFYSGSMLALGSTWYSQYDHAPFHWFNDNSEWLQMDKAGHAFTAWKLNSLLYEGFLFSGYKKEKAILYSCISSNLAMASIELFDGFSQKWGASYGDLLFNFSGTALFSAQKMWMKETWLIPKFSFHATPYDGPWRGNLAVQVLKDYNGQTYWLAMPLKRVYHALPEWLCISLGYGAEEMISGREEDEPLPLEPGGDYDRYRQFYASFDIHLGGIKTRSTFLRTCFNTFNLIRIPFPALEYSQGKLKGHFLYY